MKKIIYKNTLPFGPVIFSVSSIFSSVCPWSHSWLLITRCYLSSTDMYDTLKDYFHPFHCKNKKIQWTLDNSRHVAETSSRVVVSFHLIYRNLITLISFSLEIEIRKRQKSWRESHWKTNVIVMPRCLTASGREFQRENFSYFPLPFLVKKTWLALSSVSYENYWNTIVS